MVAIELLETRLTTGTLYTDKLFTGQREMTGLGIYHYGARFYSPKLGRFLSADSLVPGGVQGYDRYAYANNDPVKYVDPTGHSPCDGLSGYRCWIRTRKMQEAEAESGLIEWFNIKMTPEEVTDLISELTYWIDKLEKINDGLSASPLLELAGVSTIAAFLLAPAVPLWAVTGSVTILDWMAEKTLSNTISDLQELRYQIATHSGAKYDDATNTVIAQQSITLSVGSDIVSWNIKVNGDKVIEHSNIWSPPFATDPLTVTPTWIMIWYEFDYLPYKTP